MSRIQNSTRPADRARSVRLSAPVLNQARARQLEQAKADAVKDAMTDAKVRIGPAVARQATDPTLCTAWEGLSARLSLGQAVKRGLANVENEAALAALKSGLKEGAKRVEDEAAQAPAAPSTYTVVAGDTLSGIAAQHGVPLDDVIAANPQIENPDLIEVGQVINLPDGANASPAIEPLPGETPTTTEPSASGGGLPSSAAHANEHHLTQFYDPTYNPSGPLSSTNCGPASFAITLDTIGKMPPGLTPEQRVDYARSLMNPGTTPDGYVTASDGTSVPQLSRDHDLSNTGQISTGLSSLGVGSEQTKGWDALDAALEAGKPVIADGDAYQGWRDQFPHEGGKRYGSGDIGHLNTILGKTPDGKYIVSDPMYTGGPVEMTREQLAVFFGPTHGGTPSFLVVG